MKSFIYIPEISIYIFINIKISIKRCKNVEFFTKNALQTAKTKILFKIVVKVSKYEKNNTIHNGCWRYSMDQRFSLSGYTITKSIFILAVLQGFLAKSIFVQGWIPQRALSKSSKNYLLFPCQLMQAESCNEIDPCTKIDLGGNLDKQD